MTLFVYCALLPSLVLANQTGYVVLSYKYYETLTELSYSIATAVASLLTGPLTLLPFARVIGRTSSSSWSLLSIIATQIWAAKMTVSKTSESLVASRLLVAYSAKWRPLLARDTLWIYSSYTNVESKLLHADYGVFFPVGMKLNAFLET